MRGFVRPDVGQEKDRATSRIVLALKIQK